LETLLVTLVFDHGEFDIQLPADSPLSMWLPSAIRLCFGSEDSPLAVAMKDGRRVLTDTGLAESGVLNGDRLYVNSEPSTSEAGASLTNCSGPPIDLHLEGRHYLLTESHILIGRDPRCQIQCDLGIISRQHLRVSSAEEGLTVTDLGSANGSWLQETHGMPEAGTLTLRLGHPAMGPLLVASDPSGRPVRGEALS
jgi:FHA domain/WXG100 protein secretion system (Wss), protein YukD